MVPTRNVALGDACVEGVPKIVTVGSFASAALKFAVSVAPVVSPDGAGMYTIPVPASPPLPAEGGATAGVENRSNRPDPASYATYRVLSANPVNAATPPVA